MADMVHISKVLANVIASLQELQVSITEPEKEANKPQVTITLEEVRRALAELSRDGFTTQVRELLMKYGAKKLSEVNPDKYEALMQEAGEIRGK